jgi:hypothetical protein
MIRGHRNAKPNVNHHAMNVSHRYGNALAGASGTANSLAGASAWLGRSMTRALLGAALVSVVLLGSGAEARAQDAKQASCTFLEIQASSGAGGIDGALKPLAGKLEKPPFSTWKSFSLVARHPQTLPLMKAVDVPLKMGGKLSALFRQHSQSAGKKDRVSLSLALDDKSGKRALDTKVHVDEGDYFVIVTSQSADGGQLLAFSCTAE